MATYERATPLFRDLPRLARLVNDPGRPVPFLFAGKAHPEDRPGQALLREVVGISMRPELQGRVLVLEDYKASMRSALPRLKAVRMALDECGNATVRRAVTGSGRPSTRRSSA